MEPDMSEPRILLTGFEPFDGESVNPSWLVARALDGEHIAGHAVHAVQLRCVFCAALQGLDQAMRTHRPRLVLALGQASRPQLSIERVAINVDDARIPDNNGASPIDNTIVPGGPAAYFSRLPIKAITAALNEAGIAAEVSQTAGTFVCNHVFYGLMHRLRRRPGVRGGFIHLPLLPEQAQRREQGEGMPLARMIDGIRCALQVAASVERDIVRTGGAVD